MRALTAGLILLLATPALADDGPERTVVDITVAAGMGMAMIDGDAVGAFGPQVGVGRGRGRFSVEAQYQLSGLADEPPGSSKSGWAHRLGVMGQYTFKGDKDASLLKDRFRGIVEVGGGRQWVDLNMDGALRARSHASVGAAMDMRGRFGGEQHVLIAVHLGARVDVASRFGSSSGVDVALTILLGSGISW